MTTWIATNMAPIMFSALVVFLLLGYPVAFSLGACGLFFFVIGVELAPFAPQVINLDWPLLGTLPERVFGVMNNDTLLAIPFFTFMGLVLERSGMAEDLLDTIGQVFGTLRGGLAYAVIFVGALLAATTGVVAASVISMGLISLPIMLRYGYDRRVASGVIAASGTLAQIIPPSLVLIVMADQLGKSVGDMYEGAFIPGIVLACLYAGYIALVSIFKPEYAPGLPADAVGFKETNAGERDFVGRIGGLLTVGVVAFILWRGLPTLVGDLTNGWDGFLWSAVILLCLAALLYVGGKQVAVAGDVRGLTSLLGLSVVSGLAGYLAMAKSTYAGADFVVLCMAVGITVAFATAVGNWWRGLAGVIGVFLGMYAAYVFYGMYAAPILDWPMAEMSKNTTTTAMAVVWAGAATLGWAIYVGLVLAVCAIFGAIIGLIPPLRVRVLSLIAQQATFVMVPPLFLIFLVLGTIFIGVATPTEGGAMGAMGAVLLAAFKRWLDGNPNRFNFKLLQSAVESTAKLSAFVLFILVGARIFSLTFYGVNGHLWVEHLLTSLPGGQVGFLIFTNIFVFLLAFFLDFFELAFIVIPLLGPAAEKLHIDIIWFGVMLGVNMQTSFMHPPFGFALFYLRSVAPTEVYKDKITGKMTEPVTTGQIYYGAIPFVIIQCIMVALVITFPSMVMHYKKSQPVIDPSKVEINLPGIGGVGGLPSLGNSPFGGPPPSFGAPPSIPGPAIPPPPNLSAPPSIPTPPAPPAPVTPPAAPISAPAPAPVPTAPPPAATPPPAAPAPTAPSGSTDAAPGAVPPPPAIIDATKPPATDDLKPKE